VIKQCHVGRFPYVLYRIWYSTVVGWNCIIITIVIIVVNYHLHSIVSDIAVFVLKMDVKLKLTNCIAA